ncbi:MAG: hypothetical protein LBR15_00905 [Methanobrevibacter sp.]|jgi:hypothetical protein|nr:hypothetical protein [Candidatus Methanovirga australis]
MTKYNIKIHGNVSPDYKERWDIIKKENPEITLRHIFETFLDEYLSTSHYGTHLKIKEIKKEIKENHEKINELNLKNNKLEIKLKTCQESLKNDGLNKVMKEEDPNLMKATESIKKIITQRNYNTYDDIPQQVFHQISKHNKVNTEKLQEKIRTQI